MTLNRDMRRQLERENAKRPVELTPVPREQWPSDRDPKRIAVYRSRDYLVQVFEHDGGVLRLSVNRTKMLPSGRWEDGLTWDELQLIKRQIGLGDMWAVEVYPLESKVVNVASMRHLFIVPVEFVPFAWGAKE